MPVTGEDSVEQALVHVARGIFAERGYAEASLNVIVEAAGFSKGAVYYYFSSKQDLFRAVYLAEQQRLIKSVVLAAGAAGAEAGAGPWDAFHAGVRAYIEGLLDSSVRRIVLIDGPVALSWDEIRDAAVPSGIRLIRDGLSRAADAGLLAGHRVDLLANFIYGAVCEAAHLVGNSPHPDDMLGPVLAELRSMLDSLVA
jgi:AcrR family transcriptional regulator